MTVISIIVPVYNVEKYLSRCIDSILTQTFYDFECILIDDGSTDNCTAICDEYKVKDNRIVVIHKNNGGVSSARNTGLDIAQGEWIVFVDSDDWLEPDALERLYKRQRETKADVVIGSFRQQYKERTRECVFNNYIITNKKKALSDFFSKRFKYIWGKLYKASLFKHIIQPTNLIYGEDAIVNTQILCSNDCNVISVTNDIVYNYDCSTGGISQDLICGKKKAINYFESHVFMRNFLKQKQYFHFNTKILFYNYIFLSVYIKVFYNIPKFEILKLFKEAKFPYIFFFIFIKSLFYNIMNILFLINQNLYKIIIRNYINFRQKL
jgi:glycosyltransferase involved in cell wall biosynthesis